eukprot:jgi/Pico_ML_1/54819/g681.t1
MVKFRVEAELPMEVDAYFADAWGDGPETEGFRAIMASVLNFRGMDVLERQLKEDGSKVVLEGTATVNMFGFKYVIEGIIAQQVKSTYEKLPAVVKRWKAQKLWKR